ncbi:peroxiredoxin family protein [Paenibacillus sp. GCM10027626]|uniref:peroxiredoxin family protein n=1 Tax=Paenibacillus sp. GCM10027626 TaxID=3273411 RepID=UPI003626763C
MKKAIVTIALVALVIYGVYDLTKKNKPLATPLAEQAQQEAAQQQKPDAINDRAEPQPESEPQDVIGLERGNIAPDFTLQAFEGEDLTLSSFRGEKVILNLWASWCPPCRAEMPDMQAFYEDHQANGIKVLAVNLTAAEKAVEDVAVFVDEYKLTFPVAMDDQNAVAEMYRVRSIPSTFILDEEGKIIQKIVGPMTYEMMEEFMQ